MAVPAESTPILQAERCRNLAASSLDHRVTANLLNDSDCYLYAINMFIYVGKRLTVSNARYRSLFGSNLTT